MNLELLLPALQKMPALPQNTPADLGTSGFAQTMAAFQATAGSDRPQAPFVPGAEQWLGMPGNPMDDPAPLAAMLTEQLPGAAQPLPTLTDGDLLSIAERLTHMAAHHGAAPSAEARLPADAAADNHHQLPLEHLASGQPALTAEQPSASPAVASAAAQVAPIMNNHAQARPLPADSAAVTAGKASSTTPTMSAATPEDVRHSLTDTWRPTAPVTSAATTRSDVQAATGNLAAAPQMTELPGAAESRQELRVDGLSQLLSSQGAPSNAAASTMTPSTTPPGSLTAPLNSPNWSAQLSQQVITMGQRGGEQLAELRLNPHDLGPLTISLKITEHGAQAQFLSANAAVRQAVEQAIPQLRDALAEQGISLGDTSVGEHRQQQEQQNGQAGNRFAANGGATEQGDQPLSASSTGMSHVAVADGRVDLYA